MESGLPVKKPVDGKVEQTNKNNSKGSRSNINRTPLRSKIPQAVTTPPAPTRPSNGPAASTTRIGRPLANNNRTSTPPSNIVSPKVVSSKTSSSVAATPLRQHNNSSQPISSRMLLASRTTPSVSHQRLASAATSPSSTNLLKSVKPGLPAAQPTATCSIQGSRIPRPSSSIISSGGQPKSSPSAASARLVTHATSSSSSGLSAAHRHPSSPSLLLQGNNSRTATTAGVKSSSLHKSTSRLHLTHKGESTLVRSDLVSAH